MPVQVGFYIRSDKNHRPQPIDNFLMHPDWYVAYLASLREITCCDLQGGFSIVVDNDYWNAEETPSGPDFSVGIDEFSMTVTWLEALVAVARGAEQAGVWFWEESRCKISRAGNTLTINDEGAFREVAVDFADFSRRVIRETQRYISFTERVEEAMSHFDEERRRKVSDLLCVDSFRRALHELRPLVENDGAADSR